MSARRHIVLVLSILAVATVQAQQHSIYSQYIFNLYSVNPAYAGEREGLATGLSYRAQWVGFDGAPTTGEFYAHSPLGNQNMAVGIQVRNDRIGARDNTSFMATYSYKVKVGENARLSFGLSAGMANHTYRWDKLEFAEGSDPLAAESEENVWSPTADFGVMFVSNNAYIGAAVIGVDGGKLLRSELSEARRERLFNFAAGVVIDLGEDFALKPSGLVKLSTDVLQFDAGLGARFFNALWLTGTYRYEFGSVFSAHYYVNDKFHFGYAFDLPSNELLSHQNGTHEIFIGFDLNYYPKKAASPRQF